MGMYEASISKEEKLRYLYSSRSRSRYSVQELDKKIAELCNRYMTFRRYDAMLRENELPVVTEYVKRQLDSLPRDISGAVEDVEAHNRHIAMMDEEIEKVEKEIEKREELFHEEQDSLQSDVCVKCGRRFRYSQLKDWDESGSTHRFICKECAGEEGMEDK